MPTGHETSSTGCVQHEPPHDQRREAGRIPGRGSVMGSGMASHTAWRARVTAGGGGGAGGSGGRRGHRSRGRPGDILHAAEPPADPRGAKCGTCQVQPHRETGTSPRGLVGDAAGFRHQLSPKEKPLSRPGNTAGPHVQMPKTNPRAAPSRGVSPTDSPGFGFLQLPGPSAPSYPFPTQPWNQPWGPPLALPCLLPGPTRGVPAGTLSAPETLTRPPPLCGPPALVPHPQHQLPQCRDPQNGWN